MSDSPSNTPQPDPKDPQWVRLVPVSRCQPGGGTFVEHLGIELGVFVVGSETVFITDNACPHAGGNLSAGEVADGIVTCPWHHWQFDLRSGVCVDSTAARVRKYPARIHEGWVEISISGDDTSSLH